MTTNNEVKSTIQYVVKSIPVKFRTKDIYSIHYPIGMNVRVYEAVNRLDGHIMTSKKLNCKGMIVGDYPNYIIVEVHGKEENYRKAINKVDILIGQIIIKGRF